MNDQEIAGEASLLMLTRSICYTSCAGMQILKRSGGTKLHAEFQADS